MASIVLSAAGKAIDTYTGVPGLGETITSIAGAALSPRKKIYGPKLADLAVQTSTFGRMIPIVYGSMRLSGNIIWSLPIKETATTTKTGGKGGGTSIGSSSSSSTSSTSYSYSITAAVAICEGPIDDVLRIWADAKQLDLSQYTLRVYKGSETQMPDSTMQAADGIDKTPAYRGLAYVMFEDFPLGEFGNRIPNFTFEVKKKAQHPDYGSQMLEDTVSAMVMIPGGGEYVYDTQVEYKVPGLQVGANWIQQGQQIPLNMQNAYGTANAVVSLDQLKATCPNVGWVSVAVSWFGTDLDAASCVVLPGVEYQTGGITTPDEWNVASFTRASAHQITSVSGQVQYGGTPDDSSLLRYLDELRSRGYKIMFYPLIFMDVSGKPWRGNITGTPSAVSNFFTKTNGFNQFVTHYANLVAGRVDAFAIGSEMKGLTKVTDTPGNYPAVNQLVSLATTVKSILGSSVKVTYAADWSEYHHTDGGWYHLDPLWSSSNIDVIGIDAYFPLTDEPQDGYDIDHIKAGWTYGEHYDWIYSDPARTTKVTVSPAYAIKNIDWFWNNAHVNPGGVSTAWTPQMKKIWFTEYGFPSVDGSSNQPNVFYDPSSVESAFPYHSKGRVDFRAQRAAIMATEVQWAGSAMVERKFLWTWDARPYPYWPDLTNVWSDGYAWKTGHWVQGKFGVSGLAAIINDIAARVGLDNSDIDANRLTDQIEGYIINSQQTARQAIETLQKAFFFDTVESDDVLLFNPRGNDADITLNESDIVEGEPGKNSDNFVIHRAQEVDLPKRINVVYIQRLLNYQSALQYAQREVAQSQQSDTLELPIVLSDQIARTIADVTLFSNWHGRTRYQFAVGTEFFTFEPGDVINVIVGGITHSMRINQTHLVSPVMLQVEAIAEDVSTYDFYTQPGEGTGLLQVGKLIPPTRLELLDLPAFPGDDTDKASLRLAATGLFDSWSGSAIYRSDDNGASYNRIADLTGMGVIGNVVALNLYDKGNVIDEVSQITVLLSNDSELSSISDIALLNGANAALVGSEIIQFASATLLEPGKYRLSRLLRGRLGSNWAMASHVAGERFVLLDSTVAKLNIASNTIGLRRQYKGVSYGAVIDDVASQDLTYTGVALKPYSPVGVSGSRDGSGNISIKWIRRTRLGGDWQDGADVPINEQNEEYQVDVLNGSTVVRTILGLSSPTTIYTASQQTADFGALQTSLNIVVYQISAITGRGYPASATI